MTVYAVQYQHRFDKQQDRFVPKFDLSTAEQFGEIEYLLSPTAGPWQAEQIASELKESLKNFKDGDHLLLIGNPVLIGMTVASACKYGNHSRFVSCLQWHGRDRKYIPVNIFI